MTRAAVLVHVNHLMGIVHLNRALQLASGLGRAGHGVTPASRARSAMPGTGSPPDAISEFEKKLALRVYCPKKRFLFVHSKSKA